MILFAISASRRAIRPWLFHACPGYDPQLMVAILDPKTHVTLWTFYEHVQAALLQVNREKNRDQAIARVFGDIKNLAARRN